jgi:hypothetical protein
LLIRIEDVSLCKVGCRLSWSAKVVVRLSLVVVLLRVALDVAVLEAFQDPLVLALVLHDDCATEEDDAYNCYQRGNNRNHYRNDNTRPYRCPLILGSVIIVVTTIVIIIVGRCVVSVRGRIIVG